MEIYDEDTLTEFELGRQRNIIRNYEFMKACGLPVKPLVYVKRVYVPLEEQFKYLSESSDSSDEEWTMERKKKKEDKNAPKSADIRRKVSNPTAFFKKKEKEERDQKENKEEKDECSRASKTKKRKKKPKVEDRCRSTSTAPAASSKELAEPFGTSTTTTFTSQSSSSNSSSSSSSSPGVVNSSVKVVTKKQTNDKHFIRQRPRLPPTTLKNHDSGGDDEDELKVDDEAKLSRYPRRGPRINYSEAEVPDDDHFLFCEQCQEYYQGECSEHCIIRPIADSSVSNGSKKALSSLPEGMEVRESGIKDAGLGVFATKEFQSGATFGPYAGEKVRADVPKVGLDTSYMWEIVKDLKVAYYINGKNEEHANWMRYVNCSRVEEEQNMVAYQFHGNIFYRVYKDVQPGTEFLVWYGEEYAGELGISLQDLVGSTNDEKFVVFKCGWCSVCYTREEILLKHEKYCKKKPRKSSASLSDKNTNVNIVSESDRNSGTQRKSHLCQICGKGFSVLANLKMHLRVHTGEKPFCCQQCGKKFSQQGNFTRHQLTHTPQARSFICEVCGYKCNHSCDLKTHMRTHTGETPFKCDICGEGFTQSNHLKNHMSKHTGVKRFKCEQCEYETNFTSDLKNHMYTHTGEKPYHCELCEYQCIQKQNLRKHVKRRHPTK